MATDEISATGIDRRGSLASSPRAVTASKPMNSETAKRMR